MILALVVFTGVLFAPSPVPPDAADPVSAGSGQPSDVRDLSAVLAGIEERVSSSHPLNLTPGSVPGTADEPAVPDENKTENETENTPAPVPEYDDDELARLVEENSISLMLLSVQNVYALQAWDEKPAKESAAALRTFAADLLKESSALRISDDRSGLNDSFALALGSYVAAGEALQGDAPLNRTMVDTALEANRQGSNRLREAFGCLQYPVLEAPGEIAAVNLSLPRPAAPGKELALLQRYIYEDRSRANDISLMLESTVGTGMYHLLDGSGEAVVAEPGRMFLLVEVKATNLGHRGENRVYTVRTPDLQAFTLHYRNTTYAPVKLSDRTSLGEPYAAATLNRYEKKAGYIVFDVPAALPLDECSVRVDLGGDASPVWALGRTLGSAP
jgi:hypothetical protein